MKVSSLELTAIDLLRYAHAAGTLDANSVTHLGRGARMTRWPFPATTIGVLGLRRSRPQCRSMHP
jgi:hypothetical protein